jgi:hypothetical protein
MAAKHFGQHRGNPGGTTYTTSVAADQDVQIAVLCGAVSA